MIEIHSRGRYYTVFTAVENREGIAFYQYHGLIPLHTTMIGEAQDNSPRGK